MTYRKPLSPIDPSSDELASLPAPWGGFSPISVGLGSLGKMSFPVWDTRASTEA